jgi:hypothetical protein
MSTFTSAVLALGVLLSASAPCNAQNFNRRYDPFGQQLAQVGFDIEDRSDSSFVFIAYSATEDSLGPDLYFYGAAIVLTRISWTGNQLSEQSYTYPWHGIVPGWSNCCDTLAGGGYIVGGTVDDTLGNMHIDLIALDGIGDTIWTHEFDPGNDNWDCQQVKTTPDRGFILCGNKSWGSTIEGFVIKTDSMGDLQWTQTYNNPGGVGIASVAPVADGGYLLGGGALEGANGQRWLLRIDSLGNAVWPPKIWGSAYNDAGLSQCIVTSDGEIIGLGGMAYADDYDAMKPYLTKVDMQSGESIWEHVYGPERYATLGFSVKECPNLDLISCGATTDADEHYIGFLLRTTADGDSLWMRGYYYADTLFSNGQGRFHDVLPTPDGGFIATGAAYNPATSVYPPGYSQDVWVLKVDSLGCIVPGCDGLTGITEQYTNLADALKLYPNPVHGELHVDIKLPADLTGHGPLTLSVTSLDGKRILQQQVPTSAAGEVVVDVSSLSSGMYSLHLSDATRWLAGKKFVVQ